MTALEKALAQMDEAAERIMRERAAERARGIELLPLWMLTWVRPAAKRAEGGEGKWLGE